MDTIWIVALVLFCFMTGHSRTAALIMFWTSGLMALAFGLGGGFAVWSHGMGRCFVRCRIRRTLHLRCRLAADGLRQWPRVRRN